jgi:hypothetical protein
MKQIECKFVAVDAATAGPIQQALQLCDFESEMINVGEDAVEGAIEFSDLSADDGLGNVIFKISQSQIIKLLNKVSLKRLK